MLYKFQPMIIVFAWGMLPMSLLLGFETKFQIALLMVCSYMLLMHLGFMYIFSDLINQAKTRYSRLRVLVFGIVEIGRLKHLQQRKGYSDS